LDYLGGQRNELTKRHVEPLGLVYYSDNWHLIAHCRLRRDVRDFRTDRIVKLQLQNELFSGHADFSLKAYLETRRDEEKFEMARVRFKPEAMERVRRERAWGLVEEKSKPDSVEVTLLDFSLEWLACWILSFGSMAEALAPERLRQLVAAEVEKIVARYALARPLSSSLATRSSVRKSSAVTRRPPDAQVAW
jgi:predicted DNA-binding transcriptional regulator YafY